MGQHETCRFRWVLTLFASNQTFFCHTSSQLWYLGVCWQPRECEQGRKGREKIWNIEEGIRAAWCQGEALWVDNWAWMLRFSTCEVIRVTWVSCIFSVFNTILLFVPLLKRGVTTDCKAASEHSGKCGFILFSSLFPGSPGSGGRVRSLDKELSEQGGAQVPVSVPPHPQCAGPEQGKSCLFFFRHHLASALMGFWVPGVLKNTPEY